MSLCLEQPRFAPVQPWGCPRAGENFGSLWPSPEKTTCSFPYRFSGKSRNSGLVRGNRDPNAKCQTLSGIACRAGNRGGMFLVAVPPLLHG